MTELSIIVPVYKEESNVPEFIRRMTPILGALTPSYEIIFALDPSPDKTEEVILHARAHDPANQVAEIQSALWPADGDNRRAPIFCRRCGHCHGC